jgi:hypothetical protein
MKNKKVGALLVLLMLVVSATSVQAQRAGFVVGIAPPAVPVQQINPPVQGFISSPVQPFGFLPPMTPPIITTTYPAIYSNYPAPAVAVGVPVIYPSPFQRRSGVTVIVPNATVITNTAIIVQQPPVQFFVASPVATRTVNPVPVLQPPSLGTTRAQVIQQFGTPFSSIVTQRTETLYFTGGVSVFLQDGRVATPQRPN